jgi:hypothetical protein
VLLLRHRTFLTSRCSFVRAWRSFHYEAPVVRSQPGQRELVKMRWGMPRPPRTGGPPVTNIRNTSSPHWRGWLKPENHCLVPANSFAEYAPDANPATGKKDVACGLRSMKHAPHSLLPASGPPSRVTAARNRNRSPDHILCTVF